MSKSIYDNRVYADIGKIFQRLCGPGVKYVSHIAWRGPRLEIVFDIEGYGTCRKSVKMADSSDRSLRRATKTLAKLAADEVYARTGKREADMKTLLSGRTV